MKKTFIVLTFLLTGFSSVFGQSKEYIVAVEELLEATGSEKLTHIMITQMTTIYKQQYPEVPEKYWISFIKKAKTSYKNVLTPEIATIYNKHYTLQDIIELTEFYKTPVGKKFIEKMPLAMQESMEVGQVWGEKIAKEVIQEIEADYKK